MLQYFPQSYFLKSDICYDIGVTPLECYLRKKYPRYVWPKSCMTSNDLATLFQPNNIASTWLKWTSSKIKTTFLHRLFYTISKLSTFQFRAVIFAERFINSIKCVFWSSRYVDSQNFQAVKFWLSGAFVFSETDDQEDNYEQIQTFSDQVFRSCGMDCDEDLTNLRLHLVSKFIVCSSQWLLPIAQIIPCCDLTCISENQKQLVLLNNINNKQWIKPIQDINEGYETFQSLSSNTWFTCNKEIWSYPCLLYTSPSPRDRG